MNLFFPLRRVSSWFWLHFQRDVCWFWSGAGRFVLNLLVMDLRTNLGTSAREFISFCEIENLPDFEVDALSASQVGFGCTSNAMFVGFGQVQAASS